MNRIYKDEFLYLTTIGRTSGQPREIEIWYVPHGECCYLIAGGREKAHWVQNLQANPCVQFQVAGVKQPGTARTIDRTAEPELSAAVAALFEAKYQWSDGLIVEIRPLKPATPDES